MRLWQKKDNKMMILTTFCTILPVLTHYFSSALLSFEINTTKIELFLNKCHSAYWRIYDTDTMPCHYCRSSIVQIMSVSKHYCTRNVELLYLIICLNITVKPHTIHRLSISYASSKNLYLQEP